MVLKRLQETATTRSTTTRQTRFGKALKRITGLKRCRVRNNKQYFKLDDEPTFSRESDHTSACSTDAASSSAASPPPHRGSSSPSPFLALDERDDNNNSVVLATPLYSSLLMEERSRDGFEIVHHTSDKPPDDVFFDALSHEGGMTPIPEMSSRSGADDEILSSSSNGMRMSKQHRRQGSLTDLSCCSSTATYPGIRSSPRRRQESLTDLSSYSTYPDEPEERTVARIASQETLLDALRRTSGNMRKQSARWSDDNASCCSVFSEIASFLKEQRRSSSSSSRNRSSRLSRRRRHQAGRRPVMMMQRRLPTQRERRVFVVALLLVVAVRGVRHLLSCT